MAMVDHVDVKDTIEIGGVILEKGLYQTKDLYFIDPGEGLYAHATTEYVVDASNTLSLVVNDHILEQIPQKHKDRLHLKPNGIIHLTSFKSTAEYKLVLADGVIQQIYRADSEEDFASFPEEVKFSHDAEWR